MKEYGHNQTWKKHGSIWLWLIHSSFYKILGLLALLAVGQTVLMWWGIQQLSAYDYGLEQAIARGHLALAADVFFVAVTLLLCSTGCDRQGKLGYTLQRLAVSERTLYVWQALYNTGCGVIFWSVELLISIGLCQMYMGLADPAMVSSQTVFLACYRSPFLHNLLPLTDTMGWVTNLFLLGSLGMATAAYPYRQRRGKSGTVLLLVGCLLMLLFSVQLGKMEVDAFAGMFCIALCIVLSTVAVLPVWEKENRDEI